MGSIHRIVLTKPQAYHDISPVVGKGKYDKY